MISNCGSDENKQYHGGKAGDQTGGEWTIRPWYNRPWLGIFRHPDEKVRAMLADMARKCAMNDNIGYDQWQRLTFWEQLKVANYLPEVISSKCETDCSAGVAAIVKAVGYRLNIKKLQNVPETMYTGNEKSNLTKAGFNFINDEKYLTSDAYLLPGDILYYDNRKTNAGHTAINLDKGAKVDPPKVVEPAKPVNTAPVAESGFKPYLVRVTITDLNIRTGPGTNYNRVKFIEPGTYTIVDQKGTWGKLKSGVGWISLNYAKRV